MERAPSIMDVEGRDRPREEHTAVAQNDQRIDDEENITGVQCVARPRSPWGTEFMGPSASPAQRDVPPPNESKPI